MVVSSAPGVDDAALAARFPLGVVTRRLADAGWSTDVLHDIDRFGALVIGPGLGREEAAIDAAVRTIAACTVPVVIDGDGLFAISTDDAGGMGVLSDRHASTVLTPHDGEFTQLTGSSPEPDRVESARRLAHAAGSVVLLKGATTVVASPGGRVYFVIDGDQRLATAGTGDVLAGIVGALLARGCAPAEAAAAGAWIHARAGLALPPLGLVAGDLVDAVAHVLNAIAP
jgi:NAD(P)H-hydrate epimerase